MKFRFLLPPALIAALFALTSFAAPAPATGDFASSEVSCPTGGCCLMMPTAATAPTPAPAAAPETCVVSGDKLGEMGPPFSYVYKEAGKPDRVILFCCKDCVKDFEKEPAKYIAKLDAATAGKATAK